MKGCVGCWFVGESPHTLLTGRVVCKTCPLATEERATRERHVANLQRCPDREARREYLEKLEAASGKLVAEDVRVAFGLWFEQKRAKQ